MIADDTCTGNAENQLTAAAGVTYTGVYPERSRRDSDGKRVRKTVGSTVTDYIYDVMGNVAAERVGSTWTKGYVYAGGLLAQYDNTVNPPTTFFVHKDHLGSARLLTKVDKSIQENRDYLPYGESTPVSDTAHLFTGKERDAESGLDNFGARYNSSDMGRFMSPDPYNAGAFLDAPQSWNAYSYVLNNPLNAIDPTGLDCVYLNDAGTGVDGPNGVDRNSNSGECHDNGGTWFDGRINSNSVQTDPNSDWVSAEGVVGDIGSNQQFSCGGSACGQDALNSFVNSITGGPSSVTVSANQDALNPTATAVFGDVFRKLRWMDPETCGRGYFVLRGAEFETGAAHGGGYAMFTHDSRSGNSVGYLAEAGVGPVSVGHESSVNVNSGKVDSSNLALVGLSDHLGGFAGYSDKNSPIQLGGYAVAFGRGGGAYVNVVPGGGCHK